MRVGAVEVAMVVVGVVCVMIVATSTDKGKLNEAILRDYMRSYTARLPFV